MSTAVRSHKPSLRSYSVLAFARSDAEHLNAILSQLGYKTMLLSGAAATRSRILEAIAREKSELTKQDLLVVYYTGHTTVARVGGSDVLQLLVSDFRADAPASAISINDFVETIAADNRSQVVLIIDGCFGVSGLDQNVLHKIGEHESFTILAGSSNSEVGFTTSALGGSVFTSILIKAISDLSSSGTSPILLSDLDGCKAGWISVTIDDSGVSRSELVDLVDVLRNRPTGLRWLAIDIPIGLVDGPRSCDVAARRMLGQPRGRSVFTAPCRAALSAADYFRACDINFRRTGKRLSQQAWGIAPKIKAVDDAITPEHQSWVCEVHPEVCFWYMAGRRPMLLSKHTSAGVQDRLALLCKHFPGIHEQTRKLPTGVAVDDVLDAAAAAVTALRRSQGEASWVCEPQMDERKLQAEIVY